MPVQPMSKKVPCECRRPSRACPGIICEECSRREIFEWQWEKDGSNSTIVFNNNDRDVIFNPGFSVGTAAVRGTQPFRLGYHHFWEIEMSTEVYGTDMMIGVGTDKTDLRKYSHNFVSLLGLDEQSWGLSYSGEKKHAGQSHQYSRPFGQNSIVGVHLDLWAGTLEFYLDRKPLGLAFSGLRDKVLYPIISSTAARSGMNLIFCRSYPASLQLQAMLSISQNLSSPVGMGEENASIFKCLPLPPGMKQWMKQNYWWIVSCKDRDRKREEELNNRAKCDKQRSRSRKRGNRPGEAGEAEAAALIAASESDSEVEDDDEEEDDEEEDEVDTSASQGGPHQLESTKRQGNKRSGGGSRQQKQCTRSAEGGGNAPGETSCMRLLAASSSGAEFLGRVSPIFVGLPEGGFSILSMLGGQRGGGSGAPSPAPSSSRTAARSRSVPAQPSSATSPPAINIVSATVKNPREPSSSEDEDNGGNVSTRREPKRLRLRASIDGEAKENAEDEVVETESTEQKALD